MLLALTISCIHYTSCVKFHKKSLPTTDDELLRVYVETNEK